MPQLPIFTNDCIVAALPLDGIIPIIYIYTGLYARHKYLQKYHYLYYCRPRDLPTYYIHIYHYIYNPHT